MDQSGTSREQEDCGTCQANSENTRNAVWAMLGLGGDGYGEDRAGWVGQGDYNGLWCWTPTVNQMASRSRRFPSMVPKQVRFLLSLWDILGHLLV